MEYDVFISYSHPDKAAADAACATLEQAGIRCWIAPRDIVPGMDWGESIVTATTGAKVLVLIFSQHANESPQIKREVERAVAKGLPIIPVRIEDTVPSKALVRIGTRPMSRSWRVPRTMRARRKRAPWP